MRRLRRFSLVLVACASLYPASYVLLLDPEEAGEGGLGRFASWKIPSYRVGGRALVPLFAPMNRIDQALRPSYWAEHEVSADELVIDRIEEIPVPDPVSPEEAVRLVQP